MFYPAAKGIMAHDEGPRALSPSRCIAVGAVDLITTKPQWACTFLLSCKGASTYWNLRRHIYRRSWLQCQFMPLVTCNTPHHSIHRPKASLPTSQRRLFLL